MDHVYVCKTHEVHENKQTGLRVFSALVGGLESRVDPSQRVPFLFEKQNFLRVARQNSTIRSNVHPNPSAERDSDRTEELELELEQLKRGGAGGGGEHCVTPPASYHVHA